MSNLYNITPNEYEIVKFIDPSKFSTKTGNNYNPGKYGDIELYIMGLITIEEYEERMKNLYLISKNNNYITENEYNSRVNNNELFRKYNNICDYYNNTLNKMLLIFAHLFEIMQLIIIILLK